MKSNYLTVWAGVAMTVAAMMVTTACGGTVEAASPAGMQQPPSTPAPQPPLAVKVVQAPPSHPEPPADVPKQQPPAQPSSPQLPADASIYVPPLQAPSTGAVPSLLGVHIVQPGDTLYCIGRAYQVDPMAIAQANSVYGYAVIVPGQGLMIPATHWINIPPGPVCKPQFTATWTAETSSASAASVCGNIGFSYPSIPPAAQFATQERSTTVPPVQSYASFSNGYGETFAITVTGRRADAVLAFTSNLLPVCLGAARPQPTHTPVESAMPAPQALAAPQPNAALAPSIPNELRLADVLSDPNTFNLVIEFDMVGAAAGRYGPGANLSFVIDPSIGYGVTHYFWPKSRDSANTYLTALGGYVDGVLYQNCTRAAAGSAVAGGSAVSLSASGPASYGLTAWGRAYGYNAYNVAGTWGNLENLPNAPVCQ